MLRCKPVHGKIRDLLKGLNSAMPLYDFCNFALTTYFWNFPASQEPGVPVFFPLKCWFHFFLSLRLEANQVFTLQKIIKRRIYILIGKEIRVVFGRCVETSWIITGVCRMITLAASPKLVSHVDVIFSFKDTIKHSLFEPVLFYFCRNKGLIY